MTSDLTGKNVVVTGGKTFCRASYCWSNGAWRSRRSDLAAEVQWWGERRQSIANNATGNSIAATQWRSVNLALAPNNGAEILLVIRLGNRTSHLILKDFWNKNASDRYGKAW